MFKHTDAECEPCLQVIFACVYGVDTTLRLKQAGMEFAVWVFKQAADAQLAPMAPVVLQGLLRLLDAGAQAASLDIKTREPDRLQWHPESAR